MKEIWKDVVGYEGLYQVSDLGNVKSIKFNKEIMLKPRTNNKGYLYVKFRKKGCEKNFVVHRLVALSFLENKENKPCINHKDENPKNNNVNNLEWCTYKENNNYGNHNIKLRTVKSKKSIICVETGRTFISQREATRITGINQASISKCCNGKCNTAGKYHWKYKDAN